ncbi:MAG: nicotinamide riboside transporter PnuC [Cyclobacteriaceae bacterium]
MLETLAEGFLEGIANMTWMEGIAFVFGVISVWFEKQENILVFPTGLVNVFLSIYVCFTVGLYADMGINAYYFAVSIYGWINWSRTKNGDNVLQITYSSLSEHLKSATLTALSFVVIYFLLNNLTNSDVPLWDALTTSLFITAMWLVAHKKIENWHYWIAGNLISIPLYFSKGLMLFSAQYVIFFGLAIWGLVSWRGRVGTTFCK